MRLRYSKNPWPYTVWTNRALNWTTPGAGLAFAGTEKTIGISRPLCALHSDDEVRDTILHEVAHALAWKRYGETAVTMHAGKKYALKQARARQIPFA